MTIQLVKLGKLVQLVKSSIGSAVRGFTPYALGIIVIGLTVAGLMGKFAQKTEAAWYDDTFVYRRAIRFGNTGATVTDQKVLIAMNTSSTSGLIQDERMQTDCDDTRFTDANGVPLQYYINVGGGAGVGCNDASTDYYVLMPRIEGGGDTLIYMYYGNYNAVSASAAANFSQATFSPTSGPSTAAEEIGTAPVLYWNFDEGYGTTANDLMIQRNNGTITGSWATEDRCVSGKCIQMNGSSHQVIKTYASDFELDVSSNSFTVSLWMRHASALAGTDTLVSRVSSGGYKIAASSGSFCFAIDDDASTFDPDDSACTSSTYNDSTWHQVTAVKNGTTSITLYVDGNQVAQDSSLTGTGSLSGSSPEFDVGVDGASNWFDGAIDEVKVYNTAKTAAQIKAEYSSRSASGEGSSSVAGTNTIPSLSNGLVGYWRMDETGQNDCDGTNDSCDVSGNINHGTWTNNATVTGGGKFGNGVWFDGTTDYVSVVDSTSLSVTTQVSLGLWINSSTSVASESLVVKNNSYRLVTDSNSNPVCQVSDGTSWQTAATSTTTLITSTWYHVGCSYDGQTIKVFVNGVETGRNSLTSSIGDNANALEFGRDAGGTYTDFGGVLDEARLYNRGLSPKEIEQIYNFAPGPVGWWKMDENTGTVSTADSSGNNNAGTFTSMSESLWKPGKIGSGVLFDINGSLRINASSPTLFDQLPTLTASAWIYPESGGDFTRGFIIAKTGGNESTGPGWAFGFSATANMLRFYIDCATQDLSMVSTSNAIPYNQWSHVAASWDGTSSATGVKIYVNGINVTSTSGSDCTGGKNDDNASSLTIGSAFTSGRDSDGIIDDARVYNYVRSPKQIIEDMNAGHPASGSPIGSQTIYWPFDEQNGATANNAVNPEGSGQWDGTVNGADWRLPDNNCKVNGCLTFPTTTDDVSAGDTAFTDSLTAMSVTLWVSPTTLAASKGIVTKSNFSTQNSFAIVTGTANDEVTVFIPSSTSDTANYVTTSGFDLTTSTFAHLSMVYDGTQAAADRVKVYKNGYQIPTTVTGTIPTSMTSGSTSNLTVGESGSATYTAFDSHMDEVKIYNFALTASEVLVDMNAGSSTAMGGVLGVSGSTPHDSEGFGGNPPVGWWKMDENTGASANDSSGNGFTGSWGGTSINRWKSGKFGSAGFFNGTDDTLTAGVQSPLQITGDVSVSAWINARSIGNDEHLFAQSVDGEASDTNNLYSLRWNTTSGNDLFYEHENGAGVNTTNTFDTNLSNNTWYHVFLVRNTTDKTIKLYINGIQTTSTYTYTNNPDGGGSGEFSIGIRNPSSVPTGYFDGRIDDVRVYNYARTAVQIAYDYNRGGPVAWYQFDECQGATAFNASADASGVTLDTSGGMSGNINVGASGNTAYGTCGSGTTTEMWNNGTTGKMNASLDFDGTDDVVTVTSES